MMSDDIPARYWGPVFGAAVLGIGFVVGHRAVPNIAPPPPAPIAIAAPLPKRVQTPQQCIAPYALQAQAEINDCDNTYLRRWGPASQMTGSERKFYDDCLVTAENKVDNAWANECNP